MKVRGGIGGEILQMRIKELLHDEAAVEPIVMKLLAAVALLAIGLGIGIGLYRKAGGTAENILENTIKNLEGV